MALAITAGTSVLANETDGFAVNFTDTGYFGGPTSSQQSVQVRTSSVDVFSSSHTFFSQTGSASPKYVKSSSTTIGWSPHNMFLNSDAPVTQNVTLVVGFRYTYGITGTGSLAGSAGASGTATAGSPVTFAATTTTGTFTKTGTLATIWLNRGDFTTTYISTTGAIKYGLPISYGEGLVVEPAATNVILQSQSLGSWDFNSNCTISSDATIAPDGSMTADKVVDNANTSGHYTQKTLTGLLTSATVYTGSFYAKAAEQTRIALGVYDGTADFGAAWNLSTGTLINIRAGGGTETATSITGVGNGWYRCTMTLTTTNTGGNFKVYLQNSDATPGVESYTGTGSQGVYIWGCQLETGAIATSYIPTISASETRAADNVTTTLSSIGFSTTAGTIGVEFTPSSITSPEYKLVYFGTSASGTPHIARSGNFFGALYGDASAQINNNLDVVGRNIAKYAFTSGSSAFRVASTTVTSTDVYSPAIANNTTVYLGRESGVVALQRIIIARLVYVPRRVSDTELLTWCLT